MGSNPAGSVWSKWDLHVHTPASIVHNYGGHSDEVWDSFIKDLESLPKEFKVLGINDYIFIDGYERLLKAKRANRLKNIDLLLPVIELRLDKFGGVMRKGDDGKYSKSDWSRVNLHVIFDQIEPEIIRQQFLGSLVQCYQLIPDVEHLRGKWQAVISPDSLKQLGQLVIDSTPDDKKAQRAGPLQEGFNNLCCNLEKILEALQRHDLQGRHLLAVGKTEWADMKWDDQTIAEKRNIINRVDIVFTAAANPQAYETAKQQLTGVNNRLFDCSDAHAFSSSAEKDRIGNCFTWVKSDPTFRGLQHAVAEFEQRVFVGDTPEKRLIVRANRTKYASRITVQKKPASTLEQEWFRDVNIPLNHDLVAIIGNKGSGKSALADIAALAGNTKNFGSFSFLNPNRFRNPRTKLAGHFVGTLHWEDGTASPKDLDTDPDPTSVERVKYLPQSYLETLCNELSVSGSTNFDAELRKIIYTHVPEEERLGYNSLDELLTMKVSELEEARQQAVQNLSKLNAEIITVERKLLPQYKTSLEEKLTAKRAELAALEDAKPTPVDDPLQSEEAKRETEAATVRLDELTTILRKIDEEDREARNTKAEALRRGTQISRIVQAIRNHQRSHDQFIVSLDEMLAEVAPDIKAADIVHFRVKLDEIDRLVGHFRSICDVQDAIINDHGPNSLIQRRFVAEEESKAIKSTLGEKQRLFLLYQEQLAEWERRKAALVGDGKTPDSEQWLIAEIAELAVLPAQRDILGQSRSAKVREIHQQLGQIVSEYRTLYHPVQRFVDSPENVDMALPLEFNVRIAEDSFQESFLTRINRQTRGSFAGIEESEKLVNTLLQETDFDNEDATIAFVEKVDDMLHFDRRETATVLGELSVADQLRRGHQVLELYDYLFGLEYLAPKYSLTFGKQEISQLSPGERGLLLLVFYLLVDKDDIPLVIDQPEENLDNQTIFKILVACIKRAKKKRQVIMVTHNPNLAVVCDAEQIIYASCDKTNNLLSYESGAIEAPAVKARVVEILEGTQPAFDNRKLKYGY